MNKFLFKFCIIFLTAMFILSSPNEAISGTCLSSDVYKIRVSGHAYFPPIGWHSERQKRGSLGTYYTVIDMRGFGIEFMTEFFNEIGHENFKYVYKGTMKEAIYAAEKGEIDIIFGIPHMADPLLGVKPIFPSIFSSPIIAIIPADKELKLTRKEDLIGVPGISSKTDHFGETFPQYVKNNLTVYKAKNMEEAFSKMLDGEYTYMMASYYYAHAEAVRLGIRKKIQFIPVHLQNINLFMAISKRSPCLEDAEKFTEILKNKYFVKTKYDEGIRKIIREAMFEWEQNNDTYRFDPEYQTIKDVDTNYGTSIDKEKEYKEKWQELKTHPKIEQNDQ